jgi:hypothetical protein
LIRVAGAALLVAVAAAAETATIGWEQAGDHVGEDATVEGRVLGIHCSQLSCLLAFEPTFNGFTAVIQAENFDKFPPEKLDERYSGKPVRVKGKIVERDGKPEIIVDAPENLALTEGSKRREREREQVARAQAEILERIADVLERIEEVTQRLADTQERMETMLANLEEREAELAAVATQPPPEPPPLTLGDGDPQPRPGFEALRSIKRGMSRREVERLVGPPQSVERSANGWMTYYYAFGRSVSFNERGHAQGYVGFDQ